MSLLTSQPYIAISDGWLAGKSAVRSVLSCPSYPYFTVSGSSRYSTVLLLSTYLKT